MSNTDKAEPAGADKDKDKDKAAAPAKKGSPIVALGSILLSAAISGGAAFAAVRFVGTPAPKPVVVEHVAARPPGPTIPLEPFVASIPDASGQAHAIKLTLAIELEHDGKAEEATPFVPRIRDTTLSYIRERTFEQMTASAGVDEMRAELLERYEAAGLLARKVLVTDLIAQ